MKLLAVCVLASCIASCLSLNCHVCDSYLSCASQDKEYCRDSLSCYTIFERHVAVAKGCAVSCAAVPGAHHHGRRCQICHSEECNSDSNIIVAGDEKSIHLLSPRFPRNLGGRSAQIDHSYNGIGSGALVKSNKNHHNIGSGVGVEESRSIGDGVVIGRRNDQSGSSIGDGVGFSNTRQDSNGQRSSSGGIGSGVSYSKPEIGSGVSFSEAEIGQGVQMKSRRSIGRGVVPEHHRNHHKKHHQPPPPPPSSRHIGSGVEVGHRIGSGVSGYQASQNQHRSKHHLYRTRRSDLDQLVRGNERNVYNSNGQGYDSIGSGVVPDRHNHQDGPGIGHGVSPRKSSSTLTSLLYLPVSFLVRRFVF